ncbi:Saxitoxin and tetrodotoxin-binding protein 1 Precursor [Channa argus]|uniref:Saxitoxin and tetrodotoxin-binding protein 1 n=1 Tax=Channa argus TaxID=215402 RepID=A0A6G1QX28_CHAAH|nr:Saxitoxin and tetrodotoxin-binding protein 1 Precursor [Channa argus]
MNLCLSSLFLVVGLFRSSSALTSEECRPLVTPLSLADPSMMFGRTNFIVGYTDHEVYKNILKVTDSSWLNMTASPSSPNELVMYHENRINGSCYASKFNITIDGNSAKSSYANVTSAFHLLPSCEGCVLLSINSTARDADKMLKLMNFITTEKEISAHALYLLARETTVKDLDLEHFKQQASCLGFSGEPDFYYDPKKDFCREGESTRIQFSHPDRAQCVSAFYSSRMHCVVKLLLLVVLVDMVGSSVAPAAEECDILTNRLQVKDLHKIFGDWVLVWSVGDHQQAWDLFPNVSSSHVEVQLLPDKTTVVFNERNLYIDKSCSNYVINLSMPSDRSDAEHHTLHALSATVETHGHVQPYNDSAALEFYETCPDCLLLVYKNIHGRYLLSYRREGHHSDIHQLKAAHDDHRKQSECLGFGPEKPFSYDGVADFCHKKSSPVKHEQS